jgi:heavy metal sensor kinase
MSSKKTNRWRWFASIRAQLTLWGAAITMAICAVLCAILYLGLDRSLHHEVDNFLEGETFEFRSIILEEGAKDSLAEIEAEIRRELGSRLRGDLVFRLLDDQGRLRVTSDPKERLPNPWVFPPISERGAGRLNLSTVAEGEGRGPARVSSMWIQKPDGVRYIVQAAYRLSGVIASLAKFRRIVIVALAAAAALSVVGGYFLARRSLQPVETMTRAARHISATHLSDRIPLRKTNDELDRLASTLNHMLDRIERHVRGLHQFTADASHELKTPLAALRGAAEVALSKPRDEQELRRVIEDSIQHFDRLARIAGDLLLLARLDAGHDSITRVPVNLAAAIEDVVDLYSAYAAERGIQLQVKQCDPVVVMGDRDRLRQMVSNLIDNAVKYMEGAGQIDVSMTRENGRAEMRVADTGPGIPPESLPHVFDRFYRADQARARREDQGAGLGLPISRSIAMALGGSVRIESTVGAGTTIYVSLPAIDSTE